MDSLLGLTIFLSMGVAVATCVLLMEKVLEFLSCDFTDSIGLIVEDIKMLSPKYRAEVKLIEAYDLLKHNYSKIKKIEKKTKKDKENLKEIKESMELLTPYIPERYWL